MARRKSTQKRSQEIQARVEEGAAPDYQGNAVEYYLTQAFAFISANLKEVGLTAAAIVVLVLGAAAYVSWTERQEEAALRAYQSLLKQDVMRGQGTEKVAIIKLQQHIKKYTTSKARMRAEARLVGYLARAGQHKAAGDLSVKLADRLPYPEQRSYFLLQAGIHYENAGQHARAANHYEQVTKLLTKPSYPRAVALFGEARALMHLGKQREARARIQAMMKMRTVLHIEKLRAEAAAFLLNFKGK